MKQRVVSIRLTEEESALWDSWKRDGATDAAVFRWLAANYADAHGVPAPAGSGGGTLVANIVKAIRREVLPILQHEIRAMLVSGIPMQAAPPAPTPFSAGVGGFVPQQRVMNEQAAVLFNRQDGEEELWEGALDDDVE